MTLHAPDNLFCWLCVGIVEDEEGNPTAVDFNGTPIPPEAMSLFVHKECEDAALKEQA